MKVVYVIAGIMVIVVLLGLSLMLRGPMQPEPVVTTNVVQDYNLQDYVGVWVNSNIPSPNVVPSISEFSINQTFPAPPPYHFVITIHYHCDGGPNQSSSFSDWMFASNPNNTMLRYQGEAIGDIGVEGGGFICSPENTGSNFSLSYINATALQVYVLVGPASAVASASASLYSGVFVRASANEQNSVT